MTLHSNFSQILLISVHHILKQEVVRKSPFWYPVLSDGRHVSFAAWWNLEFYLEFLVSAAFNIFLTICSRSFGHSFCHFMSFLKPVQHVQVPITGLYFLLTHHDMVKDIGWWPWLTFFMIWKVFLKGQYLDHFSLINNSWNNFWKLFRTGSYLFFLSFLFYFFPFIFLDFFPVSLTWLRLGLKQLLNEQTFSLQLSDSVSLCNGAA